jgi:low temperature requirement protein LtrA
MKLSHTPRLWTRDQHGHRRVTWLELFFDLIFVAAVAQVGQPLAHDYTATGLARHAFLFVLIWWAWNGHTAFVTRFDHDDPVGRILLLIQCFAAAVMAANAKEELQSVSAAGFGAAYAGMRVILAAQYLRARSIPETRELTTCYAAGFGVAALVWVGSALLDAPERYWVWALAFLIDFATPWLATKHAMRFPPDATHYPERFGLFTIILLGEFVACVMRGIESQENWTFPAATTAFSGMAFAFLLRWWYFDVALGAEERYIRSRRQARWFDVWQYAHLPLFLGVAVAGVGFERMISHEGGGWILCAAVGASTAALAWIGISRHPIGRRLWAQLALSLAIVGIGLAAPNIDRLGLALFLLAICAAQAMLGVQETPAAIRRAA